MTEKTDLYVLIYGASVRGALSKTEKNGFFLRFLPVRLTLFGVFDRLGFPL